MYGQILHIHVYVYTHTYKYISNNTHTHIASMFGAYLFMTVIAALLINWTFDHYIIPYFILSSTLTLNSTLTYITTSAFWIVCICLAHSFIFTTVPNLNALQLH